MNEELKEQLVEEINAKEITSEEVKAEEVDDFNFSEGPQVPPVMYWQWRTTIEEVKVAKLDRRRVELEKQTMLQDIEIKQLRLKLFQKVIEKAEQEVISVDAEYKRMREEVEKAVGMSLEDCVISDVTFEVKKLE